MSYNCNYQTLISVQMNQTTCSDTLNKITRDFDHFIQLRSRLATDHHFADSKRLPDLFASGYHPASGILEAIMNKALPYNIESIIGSALSNSPNDIWMAYLATLPVETSDKELQEIQARFMPAVQAYIEENEIW